ncbi:hypothetical protein CONPUDRAFT_152892 [Coniophora puteana RWD-64-598 SS2]|uniref:Uncharacterized protein n=1 Tax=Coniophora puteana (strain RWD-64-598) TaxID=741705 RepID=A0A5M3MTX5_CONPW|nr:uncharacterized protein CONPUDRAFT_152892 [Coniophora puteana RWD-64-598 SS2]EIW82001.1 hypothetical protein CONPUDRAFT_152892 [Coniophora puteana RWD-64-598 SS2]
MATTLTAIAQSAYLRILESQGGSPNAPSKHKKQYPDEPADHAPPTPLLAFVADRFLLNSILSGSLQSSLTASSSCQKCVYSKNTDQESGKRRRVDEQSRKMEERTDHIEVTGSTDEDSDEHSHHSDAVEYSDDSYLRARTAEINIEIPPGEEWPFNFEEPHPQFDEEDNWCQEALDINELATSDDELGGEDDKLVEQVNNQAQQGPQPLGDDEDVTNLHLPLDPPIEQPRDSPSPQPSNNRPAQALSGWTEVEIDELHMGTTVVEAKEAMAYVKLLQEATINNNHHALSTTACLQLRNPSAQ